MFAKKEKSNKLRLGKRECQAIGAVATQIPIQLPEKTSSRSLHLKQNMEMRHLVEKLDCEFFSKSVLVTNVFKLL